MNPTPAQRRILTILRNARGRWVPMRWLDSTTLLLEDDFPVIPSLIENGWARHKLRSVQITPEGVEALERPSALRLLTLHRGRPPAAGEHDQA